MFEYLKPNEEIDRLIEQQKKEQQEMHDKRLLEKFKSDSGVLPRYQSLNIQQFYNDPNFQKILPFTDDHKDMTLILSGACGTGKTLAGSLILKNDFLKGKTGRYITLQQLIYQLNGNYSKAETVDPFTRFSLLVLDEVGYGSNDKELAKQADILFYILNLRYGYMLPTVIITPLDKSEFIKFAGEATKDRLNQTCLFVEFTGPSHRGRYAD